MNRLHRRGGASGPSTHTGKRKNMRASRTASPPHQIIQRSDPHTAVPLPAVRNVPAERPSGPQDIKIPEYIKKMGGSVQVVGNETATFRNTIGAKSTPIPDDAVVYDPAIHEG